MNFLQAFFYLALVIVPLIGIALRFMLGSKKLKGKIASSTHFLAILSGALILFIVFTDLLVEAYAELHTTAGYWVLFGLALAILISKIIPWHAEHRDLNSPQNTPKKPLNISLIIKITIGDILHNALHGIILAISAHSFVTLLSSFLAIILHEVPQELADTALLLHARLNLKKAITLNLLTSLAIFLGPIVFKIGINYAILASIVSGILLHIALVDVIALVSINPH